jgi:hypothetical protein
MQYVEIGVCIISIFDTRDQKLDKKYSEIKIGHVDIEHEK